MQRRLWQTVAAGAVAAMACGAGPATAQSGSGAYLAARHAQAQNDFEEASGYFGRALGMDPQNHALMESAVLAQILRGRLDRALPIARYMRADGQSSQIALIAHVAGLAQDGGFEDILAIDTADGGIGPLVDGLTEAWALIGVGATAEGLGVFDDVAQENGFRGFALYHKALATALSGDMQAAADLFADDDNGPAMMTRRGAMARAEILSQLGRNDDALAMLSDAFSGNFDPGLMRLLDGLSNGETMPFTHVRDAADGMAEVFFSVAAAIRGDASTAHTLIYGRTAQFLRPGHVDVLLLNAELLRTLDQFELADVTYRKIPKSSPDFHAAELGRAQALRDAGRHDAAVEVLHQLARDYPDLAPVHSALGDLLRQQEKFGPASEAYDRALALVEDDGGSGWFLHYARGISLERLGDWSRAEADFRTALAMRPGQPQVLNYLGYSLVEKQEKLDEALSLIEQAATAQPDSGYIIDSLGWVLYRLGRYNEAVGHMEKAVELMPVDPVVNDHLGDVYWAVGRKREADFQWRRALSFASQEEAGAEADPERIRAKLQNGLDRVLADEGAAPLKLANDGG